MHMQNDNPRQSTLRKCRHAATCRHCTVVLQTDRALQVERQRSERVTQRLVVAGNMLSKALYNLQPASPQLPRYMTFSIPFTFLHMTTVLIQQCKPSTGVSKQVLIP